jgi:transposase-like protein
MKRSRYTEEQIIGILKEQEAGTPVAELCRKHGMSDATFYTWKSKLAGSRCDIPLVGSPEIGEPRAWAEIGGTTPAALRDCETTPQSG